MTTENRSITPPQWQIDAWCKQALAMGVDVDALFLEAARWGYEQRDAANEAELQKARDEELEACCEWLRHDPDAYELVSLRAVYLDHNLHAARRPRPKSQAEEALEALNEAVYMADDMPPEGISTDQAATIRAALERLRELEEGNG